MSAFNQNIKKIINEITFFTNSTSAGMNYKVYINNMIIKLSLFVIRS